MKQYWHTQAEKFAKLSRRERAAVLIGGLVVILLAAYSLVDSAFSMQRQLALQLSKVQTEAALAQAQVAELSRQLAQDPDTAAQQRIEQLQKEIAVVDAQFENVHKGLVAPDRMAGVLEDMLTRGKRVRLTALKTLPVTTLAGAEPSAENRTGIYRHGVEITLEGSYLDLLDYLGRLERLPWQMFWATAKMDAGDYPRVTITLVLYTLSLDRKWMVV